MEIRIRESADTIGRPTDTKAVFDRAAPTYDRTGVDFFGRLGELLVAGIDLHVGQQVLDVGCGTGACTVPAAIAVGPPGAVTGIDTSTAMLGQARQRVAQARLANVTLREGDAMDPPFRSGSFDAVVAGLVVSMLRDPLAAAKAYRELLRPGGVLAMSMFGADDPRFFEVTDAVLPYLDRQMPAIPGRGNASLRSRDGIDGLLRAASFGRARIVGKECDLEFASPSQWWGWLWQTAGRVVLEQIPAPRLPEARAAACERMEQVRADRGTYVVRWNLWFVYANRESWD